jgi:hypothetical protein
MLRVLIIYNHIEVLKDFTELLKQKDFVLQCISINGATLISALEYNPDIIIIEEAPRVKSESMLRRILAKKFLFKASIHLYSKNPEPEPLNVPGVRLIKNVDELSAAI